MMTFRVVMAETPVACGLLLAPISDAVEESYKMRYFSTVFFQIFLLGFAYNFFSMLQFFHMPNWDVF